MNFFKYHWLGIFVSSVAASLVAAYLYEHVSLDKVAAFVSAVIAPGTPTLAPAQPALDAKALWSQDQRTAASTRWQALANQELAILNGHKTSGSTSTWKNPDSSRSGSITVIRTYYQASGEYCYEYEETLRSGGKSWKGYGTACHQPGPGNSWQHVSGSSHELLDAWQQLQPPDW